MTARTQIEQSALDALRSGITGEVIAPSDAGYDEHRALWNGSIDKYPAVIARCTSAEDVRTAIAFGREHDLITSVRGGGHSFPGLSMCDDGLAIDLRPMSRVEVDLDANLARVQAGTLLGELDAATQAHGMVVPAGIVTHTGVAGLTLGGGIGWVMRRYGLTIDQLRWADLVTADGEFVRASEDENADLFWGIRGGGGNFGVVTEFGFNLNPLGPTVFSGMTLWSAADAQAVLRFYRDWIADCPDDLMTIVVQRRAPDLPFVPRDVVGKHVVGVAACYAGDVEAGERVLQPMRSFGDPLLDLFAAKPFVEHQGFLDGGFVPGAWYYVRSCDVAELSDGVLDVITAFGERIESPISSLALWQMGGQVARVGEDETAFNGRHAGYTFNINGNALSGDGFEAERQWARDYWTALEPYHTSAYVNFLMEEGEERIREAYGPATYDRLKALKKKYDPTNFFRLNQNISPA